MIKQHYTGSSRRAMNVIWNAAQDYSLDDSFLAFHPNGEPDDYLNMVIGLTAKWLDRERVTDFFERLGEGPTYDEASSVLWLGIENCVYGKELPLRPVIRDLRRERAEDFFRVSGMLSEQQMSFMSIRVFDQEQIRWGGVLGRRMPVVGKNARALARELEFSPEWDSEEVLSRMTDILRKYFRITLPDRPRMPARHAGGLKGALARTFFKKQERRSDLLILRKGSGSGDAKRSVHLTHNPGEIHLSEDPQRDRAYIEGAFGPCMYTDEEMKILENSLCRDNDELCRLWFTKAGESRTGTVSGGIAPKDAEKLAKDQAAQRARNEAYWKDHIFQVTQGIRKLSAQVDTIFQSYMRYLPASAKHGKMDSARIWRMPVLGDGQVFLKNSEVSDVTVSVDLLLDASQSRMNSQEMIASQALVIARSLEMCHIPVRVSAFRSLRGYTVLQRLKEFGDRRGDGIFHYYAGGWNRDALCLKAMEYLLEEERRQDASRLRLLLVLTDANPNDTVQLPPKKGGMFAREYEGEEPVKDAEKAVRKLRRSGIRTGAVYFGSHTHLDNVHQIYGQQYVRILTLNQLPDAAAQLLAGCLRAADRKDIY